MDVPLINGIGVVWGISSGIWGTATAYLIPTEQDFSTTRQNDAFYNKTYGYVIAEIWYRKESTLRLRLYPAGTTIGNANLANQNVPEPGTEVEIQDALDPDLIGFWSIVERSKQHRAGDKVYWDMSLRRHGANLGDGLSRVSQVIPTTIPP